jgi:hypothetical protein
MNRRLTKGGWIMRERLCSECHWVSVVDGAGRRRMEMRWGRPGTVTSLTAVADRSMAVRAA